MLVDVRRLDVPRLHAMHESFDVRTRHLRIGLHRGRNVATDFTLLDRASPFVHRMRRATMTVVFEGRGRFDEGDRCTLLGDGDLVTSDSRAGGTEAYAGARTSRLVLEWDAAMEVKPGARFSVERVGRRDLDRLREAAGRLVTPARDAAIEDVLAVLRANGLRFARVEPEEIDARYASLNQALGARLDLLEGRPDVEEIATALHWSRRTVTRRLQSMARAYAFVRPHWREALRSARLLAALRLLAAPGATTELVARLTGFRAAAALCRAFADVGWPSPGRFAQAARRDPITSWRELAAAVPRYQSHG